MFEIFMAVCALTLLECNTVTVQYYELPDEDWYAAAAIDVRGDYYILVSPEVQHKSERFITRLMVHEISHLLAFQLDPIVTDHSVEYKTLCKDLQALVGIYDRYTCRPYDTPLPPWFSGTRE